MGVLDGKGTYGLTKVIHRWTAKGYENEFWCTPWKNYVSPQPPAPTEVVGVVTARVVDHNDPRKMGRIQVQYDWQESGPTGWVRATTPHAGGDRGFLFMPEIGDEVVVAFEHGDPERPYVVGYLWNGVDQAPREEFWGTDIDPNDVKRIVTKSGHRIPFVDKPGKESIVIATPQHLKISLIEKTDETGRSMILLHSDGDIFINAPGGRVHLHSSTLSQDVGGSCPDRVAGQQLGTKPSGSSPSASTVSSKAAASPQSSAVAPTSEPLDETLTSSRQSTPAAPYTKRGTSAAAQTLSPTASLAEFEAEKKSIEDYLRRYKGAPLGKQMQLDLTSRLQAVIQHPAFDVAVLKDQASFHVGVMRELGDNAQIDIAERKGNKTLEMTPGGKWLHGLAKYDYQKDKHKKDRRDRPLGRGLSDRKVLGEDNARTVWDAASKKFAESAAAANRGSVSSLPKSHIINPFEGGLANPSGVRRKRKSNAICI